MVFAHFYKNFKAISLFCFIQILFIYKWQECVISHLCHWCHDPIWPQWGVL